MANWTFCKLFWRTFEKINEFQMIKKFAAIMRIKWLSVLMLQITGTITGMEISEKTSSSKINFGPEFAVKSIQSEDGDVIDCIDIYKQPAFNHPALRHHKIQVSPTYDPTMLTKKEDEGLKPFRNGKGKDLYIDATPQLWRKSGSCPEGTVPIRRIPDKIKRTATSDDDHARKKPGTIFPHPFMESKTKNLLEINRSLAILHAEGFAYIAGKGDIKVWNPSVEGDDEYTTSQVALKSGPHNEYEAIESGWAVNPSVYGDRKTRLFTYWTIDASVKTGCFDATCPGFVQVNKDIALGAAIYPISNPTGLPSQITIFIFKDPETGNWWLNYGESVNIGYWPNELFSLLAYHAQTVQWGGEVYSTKVGTHPHTATQMGNGQYPDFMFSNSGYIKRMRIIANSGPPAFPAWVNPYTDEYDCYKTIYFYERGDPEFYYGGPGKSYMCP